MSNFRAVAHRIPPHGVLVRFYSRIDTAWRSVGQLVMSRAEWLEFEAKLTGVSVFEGVGNGERQAQ
jgi:hypothetical protein